MIGPRPRLRSHEPSPKINSSSTGAVKIGAKVASDILNIAADSGGRLSSESNAGDGAFVRGKVDSGFVGALACLTGVYLGLFVYYVGATNLRVPVYDLLGWIMDYAQYWKSGDWGSYFFHPHGEHRIAWTMLLLLIDIEWFRGETIPFLVFGLGCLVVTVGGLAREVLASDLPAALRSMLALFVVLLLTASYLAIQCSVPATSLYLYSTGFSVLSLLLLDGAGEEGKFPTTRRLGAVAASILSAFGVAGGLVAPLVLLWAAWRGRLNPRWRLGICAGAILLFAAYVPGTSVESSFSTLDPTRVLRIFDYAVRLLGLPWSHAPSLVWLGRIVGLVILGASAAVVLRRGLLGGPRGRLERISVGLLIFAMLITGLVSVGRVDVAPDREMPIRYGIFAALAQVGLLLALSPWLARIWAGQGRRHLQWAAAVGALLLSVQQISAGQAAVAGVAQYIDEYRRFAAGQWTPEMIHFVFPDRRGAERGLAIVRGEGIYQN
jgi:hypothetical protein